MWRGEGGVERGGVEGGVEGCRRSQRPPDETLGPSGRRAIGLGADFVGLDQPRQGVGERALVDARRLRFVRSANRRGAKLRAAWLPLTFAPLRVCLSSRSRNRLGGGGLAAASSGALGVGAGRYRPP